MERITLKDKNYQVIGYIDTESNGIQTLRDRNYQIKGYYDPKQNVTKDRNYQIVAHGNLLTTLLNQL